MQKKKREQKRTNKTHLTSLPKIADLWLQGIEPISMHRSILRNIDIACSQLWWRSGTLAWTMHATTSPKLASEFTCPVKNQPAHAILMMRYHFDDATINFIALPPSKQGDLATHCLSQCPHLDAISYIFEGGVSWWCIFFSLQPAARQLISL